MRLVVLGGAFGGVATTRHLERRLRGRTDVEITLVSRENFFVITPLLFEAGSGVLEPRHAVPDGVDRPELLDLVEDAVQARSVAVEPGLDQASEGRDEAAGRLQLRERRQRGVQRLDDTHKIAGVADASLGAAAPPLRLVFVISGQLGAVLDVELHAIAPAVQALCDAGFAGQPLPVRGRDTPPAESPLARPPPPPARPRRLSSPPGPPAPPIHAHG